MRRYYIFGGLVITTLLFAYCHSAKKATSSTTTTTSTAGKMTYTANVQSIVMMHCAPCHIPAQGGNKKALDTYAGVRDNIDDIIHRIEMDSTERGFMPFRHPKLSDSTIAMFKQWKTDGFPEN